MPTALVQKRRRKVAERRAAEACQQTGCLCSFQGFEGEKDGQLLLKDTKLFFEWRHVTTASGEPYVVSIRYENLVYHLRSIPNCPMRLQGKPGLRYSLDFFDQLAENVSPGLEYRGLMYEGPVMDNECYLTAVSMSWILESTGFSPTESYVAALHDL